MLSSYVVLGLSFDCLKCMAGRGGITEEEFIKFYPSYSFLLKYHQMDDMS
jgi:hypothetical protein